MPAQQSTDLYDPRHGDLAVAVERIELVAQPHEPSRTNYFTIYWIEAGAGVFWADAAEHAFGPHMLLFFVPYQHIRLEPSKPLRGAAIRFHANFLCVETFHAEVGCSGTLFNDPYGVPVVALDRAAQAETRELIERISREQADAGLAHREVQLAYLKVLLIGATRLKNAQPASMPAADPRHALLAELKNLIEQNYRTLHSPAEYARLLHVTVKTLGRQVREQLGKTPSDLIRQRILTHAKWQLLHTLRPVKEIARELGFRDELYFSRAFKKATGLSPTYFREFETEIRGGSNLSMLSSPAPILPNSPADDNSDISSRKPGPRRK